MSPRRLVGQSGASQQTPHITGATDADIAEVHAQDAINFFKTGIEEAECAVPGAKCARQRRRPESLSP